MNLTQKAQELLKGNLTIEDALPTKMPVYVNSFAYLFGVLTLSSLVTLFITGPILALFGPDWYHFSSAGKFINSLHFWSVQIFFASLMAHLIIKFLMGAWRDGRWKTWMIGLATFAVAVFTALTGYLAQTNWDSQWISVQAKDAMNAAGLGRFFNTMNTGQVLTLHVAVLPAIILALVGLHLFLIRRDGPVKPMPHPDDWIDSSSAEDIEWIATGRRALPQKKADDGNQAKSERKEARSGG